METTNIKSSTKSEMINWLANSKELNLSYGLTVMPKKVFYKQVAKTRYLSDGKIYRHLNKQELESANKRLVHYINKVIYKNAYIRNNKRINIVGVIEGDNSSTIDLHTHFILEKPDTYTDEEFSVAIKQALCFSGDFDITNPNYKPNVDGLDRQFRYKLEQIDNGWSGYITKKLDKLSLSNLYMF
jgi:hypothetical protein